MSGHRIVNVKAGFQNVSSPSDSRVFVSSRSDFCSSEQPPRCSCGVTVLFLAPCASPESSRPSFSSHALPGMVEISPHPGHSPDLVPVSHVQVLKIMFSHVSMWLTRCFNICQRFHGSRLGPAGCTFFGVSSPAVTFVRVAEEHPPCGSLGKAYQLPLLLLGSILLTQREMIASASHPAGPMLPVAPC